MADPTCSCDHVAASDCEAIRPGRIGQPVNTVSSLAYCAAGAWALRRPRRGLRPVLGVTAVVAGLGSVAYHGPGGRAGHVVHDVGAAALGVALLAAVANPYGERTRRGATAATIAVAGAVHATSRTGGPLCRPRSPLQGHALWHVLGSVAVVLAAA